jgi:hypothetical protein
VLEAAFVLLVFSSPSRRIFIGSHSLPPLWFAVSVLHLIQRFTVVVNNMRANVDVLPYDDHDRVVKLLHSLDRIIWGGKFKAIVESEKYDTVTMNELFSKLKSAEVDRGMTAKLEGPTIPIDLPSLVVRKERLTLTHPPGCSLCPL